MEDYYTLYCEADTLSITPVLAPWQYHADQVVFAMQYAVEHPEKRFTIYQALSSTELAIIDFPGISAPQQLSDDVQRTIAIAPDLALRDALVAKDFALASYVLTRGADLINVVPWLKKHFNQVLPEDIKQFCLTHRACSLNDQMVVAADAGTFQYITTMSNVDNMVNYILNDITEFYPRLTRGNVMLLESVSDYEKIIMACKRAGVCPITAYQLHLMAF